MTTAKRVRSVLHYCPETGVFSWRTKKSNMVKPGGVAGHVRHGYRRIAVDGKLYAAHRLAWLYVYGEWPTETIDHINGNKDDNAIANLRDVSRALNKQNMRLARKDSRSGKIGAYRRKNGWVSSIHVGGERRYLGFFESADAAHAAYLAAKRQFHSACTI